MMKVMLDGKSMKDREETHKYIQGQLELPEYYGQNLDALWDLLTSYGDPIKIELRNQGQMIEALGSYGKAIIQVFEDGMKDNKNVEFTIIDD